MDDPIERVAFLANSENRVAVMETLAGGSRTRTQLDRDLDVSRATLGRILEELADRHWIAFDGETYRLTPVGELVIDGFEDLVATMEVEGDVRRIVPQLPTARMHFDVERLAGSEVVRPTRRNPIAHVDRLAEELGRATRIRVLSFSVVQPALAAAREATVERDGTFEAVLTPDVYDVMADDPEMRPSFLAMLAVDDVEYYVRDADVPALFTVDDTALLLLTDREGTSRGLVLSTDPVVHSWAVDTFEAHREAGERVDSDQFVE